MSMFLSLVLSFIRHNFRQTIYISSFSSMHDVVTFFSPFLRRFVVRCLRILTRVNFSFFLLVFFFHCRHPDWDCWFAAICYMRDKRDTRNEQRERERTSKTNSANRKRGRWLIIKWMVGLSLLDYYSTDGCWRLSMMLMIMKEKENDEEQKKKKKKKRWRREDKRWKQDNLLKVTNEKEKQTILSQLSFPFKLSNNKKRKKYVSIHFSLHQMLFNQWAHSWSTYGLLSSLKCILQFSFLLIRLLKYQNNCKAVQPREKEKRTSLK